LSSFGWEIFQPATARSAAASLLEAETLQAAGDRLGRPNNQTILECCSSEIDKDNNSSSLFLFLRAGACALLLCSQR
jgi:hypothetical protein